VYIMKWLWTLLFLQVLKINGFFWNIKFGPRFNVADREYRIPIKTSVPQLKGVRGFYGLIGPDIEIHNKTTLYDLFTGDGVVQGAFIDNGEITMIKHIVRTDKLIYEEKNGRIPENLFVKLILMFLSSVRLMPNILGLANTALLNINNKLLALYERDYPYILDADFENKFIRTIKKLSIPTLKSFSAHSKFSETVVKTLDYHVLGKYVNYVLFTENMDMLKKVRINTHYLPVIHDFATTKESVIVCDAPIVLNILSIFENKLPVQFDTHQKTHFHVLQNNDSTIEKYTSDSAFYIFHYADSFENDDKIELYGAVYENLDFNELNIHGKYRKIILHKDDKSVHMETNPIIENMNLDFPVRYGSKIVLRSIENNIIQGFVVCEGLRVIKRIHLENRFICGEPAVIEGTPFLACFANDIKEDKSYLIFVNLDSYETIEIPADLPRFSIGFHGLFIAAPSSFM